MKLIIEDDEGRKTVVPFARDEISIGRQDGNTIRLTERNVSRKHCRLVRKDGTVLVEDLGSFNGVRVNGERIEGKLAVQEGDLIEIGDYDLAIEADVADSRGNDGRATTQPDGARGRATTPVSAHAPTIPDMEAVDAGVDEEPPAHQATAIIRPEQLAATAREARDLAASERPRLVIVSGEQAGDEVTIGRTEFRIGRTKGDNDFAINHRSISRNHAKLLFDSKGGWRIVDLQSANGVRVNGEDYADAPIAPGDLVELGHVKLRFVGPGEDYTYQPEDGPTPAPRGAPAEDDEAAALPRSKVPTYLAIGGGLAVVAAVGIYFTVGGKPTPAKSHASPGGTQLAANLPRPAAPPSAAAPAVAPKAAPTPAPAAAVERAPAPHAEEAPAHRTVNRRQLQALLSQAKSALRGRRLDTAEAKLSAAADIAPDDPGVAKLRRDLGAARAREEAKAARHHEHHAAPAEVAEAPAAPAEPKVDRHAKAVSEYQSAVEDINGGDLSSAVGKLEQALKDNPRLADAHKVLGICYAKLQEPDKAAPHYEQYLKLKPNSPDAAMVRKILADYYRSRGH